MITPSSHRWVLERGVLYGLDLEGDLAEIPPRMPVEFREIGPEHADELAAAMGTKDAPNIEPRLSLRRRCFGAWVGNQIASYAWVSQTDECIGEQERAIRLEPREAYIWDCATVPQFRNRRLYSALLGYIVATLKREGVRRVWIGSSAGNGASLRGFRNVGFERALDLVYVRLFGLRFLWIANRSEALALGLAARRALMTEQEWNRGPILIEWSLSRRDPCTDEAQPRAT